MKKAIVSGLVLSMIPGLCMGVNDRIYKLIQEKQAKMEKLEKCQGTTKKLKIAGLSTLGITAVGVGANIAEAVVLKDAKADVAEAKRKLEAQQKIKCLQDPTKRWEDGECKGEYFAGQSSEQKSTEPDDTIVQPNATDGFYTEEQCKKSCNTTNGCMQLSSTNKWQCVEDLPDNKTISEYRVFTNGTKCMEYCAEACLFVSATKDSPALYRCYKSKAQAAQEQKQRAELDAQAADKRNIEQILKDKGYNAAKESGDKEDALVPEFQKKLEEEEAQKKAVDTKETSTPAKTEKAKDDTEARIADFKSKCVPPYKIDNEASTKYGVWCIVAGDKNKPAKQSEIDKALKAAYKKFGCDNQDTTIYQNTDYAGISCSLGKKDSYGDNYNTLEYIYSELEN